MGTWGPAISSNDTFADIYNNFFEKYNEGLEVSEITADLMAANKDLMNDPSDSNNFWFAIAKSQWECKALDSSIYLKVEEIINSGADIILWRELEADEKSIKKRKEVLDKFLIDLRTERLKPKARKKKVTRSPAFLKGDCITFKLANGNYGGAVTLEAVLNSEYAYNLMATTNINQPGKPVKADFKKAKVLIKTFASWNERPAINWILPIRFKHVEHLFEKVDNLTIEIDYYTSTIGYSFTGDFDGAIIEAVNQQLETANPSSDKVITIKQLTRKKKFKFWWSRD